MSDSMVLTALAGSNPGAFLAALGTIDILDRQGFDVRLSWELHGRWYPRLVGIGSGEALIEALIAERDDGLSDPALEFVQDEDTPKARRDLKPTPEQWRRSLEGWLADADPVERRVIDLAAAFAAEGGVDNNGRTKPTAFHFTAGQQKFLEMALELHQKVTPEHLEEALFGPWQYASNLPVLGWDVANDRSYALRATNPSGDKKLGVPGADWLGLFGLRLLPSFAQRHKTVTTAVQGQWKTGSFTWCLWRPPLSRDVIQSLLMQSPFSDETPVQRAARGIVAVYESGINRSDQGGYGSMSPARDVG